MSRRRKQRRPNKRNAVAEHVARMDGGLQPGGSRLVATVSPGGKLGPEFVYAFRTPDGSETIGVGPLPMPKLAALSATVEPVDADMAKQMRRMLATWQAEQSGMAGHA